MVATIDIAIASVVRLAIVRRYCDFSPVNNLFEKSSVPQEGRYLQGAANRRLNLAVGGASECPPRI